MHFIFDHLVQFMEEPKKAIPFLKGKGMYAVEGGVHESLGTYNILSYYDLSYIEFFGVLDRNTFEQKEHPKHSLMDSIVKDQFTEGFSRFVVRTNDIDKAAGHFRNGGFQVLGPIRRSRKRPDGTLLTWHLLYVGDETEELKLPYIIQWDESDEKRKQELIDNKVICEHPNEAHFSGVTFAVKNVNKTIEKWSKCLQIEEVGHTFINNDLQAECRTLNLPGGELTFCRPVGEGIVSEVLKTRGEKPFQANFIGKANENFQLTGGLYTIRER